MVCDACIMDSVKRNVMPHKNGTVLEHRIMPESWFHYLLAKQVEHNGLSALGLGKLRFFDESQRRETALGRFRLEDGDEIDLLLRGDVDAVVVVEVKRRLEEAAVSQVLRYRAKVGALGDVQCVLIANEVTADAMLVVDQVNKLGAGILVYTIGITPDGLTVTHINGDGSE
jgi:hypothetical protein